MHSSKRHSNHAYIHKTAKINAIKSVLNIYQEQHKVMQRASSIPVELDPRVYEYQMVLESMIRDTERE